MARNGCRYDSEKVPPIIGMSDGLRRNNQGRTESSMDDVLSAFAPLFTDREESTGDSAKSVDLPELVIEIGRESRTPDWKRIYHVFDDDVELYGLFLGVFDLEKIARDAGTDLKRIVVVALLDEGFSHLRKDIRRGKRSIERVKKAIAKECGVKKLTKQMRNLFSDTVKLSMLTNKQKTALVIGGAALAAGAVAIVKTSSELDGDDDSAVGVDTAEQAVAAVAETVTRILPEYYDRPLRDGVERRSASQLGSMLGLTGREVNLRLHELGYLDGEPGNWIPTEKALPYVIERGESNGYGGYAARSWSYLLWDRDLVYELGDPDAYLSKVNDIRASMGMDPLDSLDID